MIALSSQIESILFVKTEGVSISYLAKILGVKNEQVREALGELKEALSGRGVQLVTSGETVLLTTHADMSDIVGSLFEEETGGELTPASLQTLSIILYKGTASRGEVSYVRGVDARMSLRNLTLRGLIEKAGADSYRPTTDCLRFLGVQSVEELPRYKDINESLSTHTQTKRGE